MGQYYTLHGNDMPHSDEVASWRRNVNCSI